MKRTARTAITVALIICAFLITTVIIARAAAANKQCDTTHTSDLRSVWLCDDVCVRILGNPPSRYITFNGVKDMAAWDASVKASKYRFQLIFKQTLNTASLNGKRCKNLPQTYDYD